MKEIHLSSAQNVGLPQHVTPYHYYVIDNLVDEARRQGAMSCLSSARRMRVPWRGGRPSDSR